MVRRAGQIIEVDDIDRDIKSEEVSDIKPSAIEGLRMLDNEFQQASMVVSLLKGVPDSDTATEAVIGQQNVQSLIGLIDANIKEALSELGLMILNIATQHEGKTERVVRMLDNDNNVELAKFKVSEIKGKYDVEVTAERPNLISAPVKQKQLLDLYAIVSKDLALQQQFPSLKEKIIKKWLEEGGDSDPEYFFEGDEPQAQPMVAQGGGIPTPQRSEGLTPQRINQGVLPTNPKF